MIHNMKRRFYLLVALLALIGSGARAQFTDVDYYLQNTTAPLTVTVTDTWAVRDNFQLSYCDIDLPSLQAVFNATLADAQSLLTSKMSAAALAALTAAIAANSTPEASFAGYEGAIAALDVAIDAARQSVDAYVELALLNARAALLDAAGQAAYAPTLAAYDNGTVADYATAYAAYLTAVLSQTTPGSDMTVALVNPDFETGDLSGWTSNGFIWQDKPAGYISRFAEKWVKGGSALPDASISQSITLLHDGVYRLSADVIACQQGWKADQTGVYLFLGDRTTLVSTENNKPERAKVNVTLDSGPVECGLKTESTNCNWAVLDNVSLTYLGMSVTPPTPCDLGDIEDVDIYLQNVATG